MRRRDFLKGVAAALGVFYLPPYSKTENISAKELLNRCINRHIRQGEWEIFARNLTNTEQQLAGP